MRIDDERDPLDSWLSREVRPLPPPPGTFELISRRARRRKMRKLAITVASTVAVAAGVAVAVPSVMALHLSPTPTNANPIAQGQSASPSRGTQSPQGTATHYTSPTPSAVSPSSVPTTPTVPTEPRGQVPPNFQPSSVTFVNQNVGWVIGQAGTPGHCDDNISPYYCTSIARTDDQGRTWEGGPAPKTGPISSAHGVVGIRFLDGVNGWAFGPELWSTHDAGNTWTPVDTQGQAVTDLETVHHRAYALFAACMTTFAHPQFTYGCDQYTLMTTPAYTDNWTPVGAATSNLIDVRDAGGQVDETAGEIALTDAAGYLLAPDGTVYSGPIGGVWEKVGPAPCKPGQGIQLNGQPLHALLGLMDSTHLALACTGWAGLPTTVYTSSDGGAHWALAPDPPAAQVTSLSYFGAGAIVMTAADGVEVLQAGATKWQTAAGPPGGFSYVGMTTATQGIALPNDMGLHELWMTFDGGLTWKARTPITPDGT